MNAVHSSEFKLPDLPKYDATGSPIEHLIDIKSK